MTVSPDMPVLHPELPERPVEPEAVEAPPEATPEPEQTPPEQAAPAESPSASERQALIFGKYHSLEEAQKGYYEQVNSFMQERAKVEALSGLLRDQRVSPASPPAPESFPEMEELENSGVPPQALERFVERVAQRAADQVYRSRVEPREVAQQAHDEAARRHPDFLAREQQVADFIQASPELDARYRRMIQADPLAAMEWAYFQHGLTLAPPAPPPRQSAVPPVAPAALPQAAVGARQAAPEAVNAEEEEAARQYALTYGDPTRWLRLRLKGVIPNVGA